MPLLVTTFSTSPTVGPAVSVGRSKRWEKTPCGILLPGLLAVAAPDDDDVAGGVHGHAGEALIAASRWC